MYELDVLGVDAIRSVLCGDRRERVRDNAEILMREPGNGENSRNLVGYPSVFNQVTTLYSAANWEVREQIDVGAFDDVLADDCHLNYVHESASAMARNGLEGLGGMELSVDAHGLRVFARLPLDDIDVQRLIPKIERGVVNQMSFAFSVADEEYLRYTDEETGKEISLYTIKKLSRLYDVCVCPLGAYAQTEAALRSVLTGQSTGRSLEGPDGEEGRSQEGPKADEGRSDEGSQTRAALMAEGLEAAAKFPVREIKESDQ